MAGKDVQHHAGRMDVVGQCFGAGGFHRVDSVRQNSTQDIDHLPVAAGLAFQFALHAADRNRQVPRLERCAVAQSTGFARQNG